MEIVFGILAVAAVLFASDRVRLDVVAILTVLALLLSGVLSPAEALSVSPRPFLMIVAIAASAAFVTPISTPVVTLVVEPAGYRFSDFLRVGIPLLLLTWLSCLLVVPRVFPF